MKSTCFPMTTLGPCLVLACLLGGLAQAQWADDAAARRPPPLPGSYYSAQRPTFPPLPWNPFPDLPLYSWGERRFIYDDREVDYSLFRTETDETTESAAPLVAAGNFSLMTSTTNDCAPILWIFPGNSIITIIATNQATNEVFDLFRAGDLIGDIMTNGVWEWVGTATNGQPLSFGTRSPERAFYLASCTDDTDADSWSDVFEALVTHTSLTSGNLVLSQTSSSVTVTITNGTAGAGYDLFRCFAPVGDTVTEASWFWMARGTNGQSLTFPACPCARVFYRVAATNDTDGDGLTDAYEVLVTKTSATNQHSVNALYSDRAMENILVNDPEQDCGNEQNTQFESTVAVMGTNVIVGFVDSNQGVYALGTDQFLTNRRPQFVAFAVSCDGGLSFLDQGVPPLSIQSTNTTDDDGDVGDPVLAVDQASRIVYLAGTSPRKAGRNGIPLWISTDGGVTFGPPSIIRNDIVGTDKEWIAVDNAEGEGQHDVYMTCQGNDGGKKRIWLAVSTDGNGAGWTNGPVVLRDADGTHVSAVNSPIVHVGPDHVAYAFWFESTGPYPSYTNWLTMCQVLNRGASLGEVQPIRRLVTTHPVNGNLELKRSNTATSDDTFRVFPFPVVAVNPDTNKAGHLYVAYADLGTNSNDRADVFLVCSTNRGTNWTAPLRVNSDQTTNDQWMPVLAIKPDGSQLFLAWYDRRDDPNNSLIDLYGRFGTIAANGAVTFGNEFRINTVSFPPVFAGTRGDVEPIYKQPGYYDPVYPPLGVNLNWWYSEWPPPPDEPPDLHTTAESYRSHVGEYNGAWAEESHVSVAWTDDRTPSAGTIYPRNQGDIRFVRLRWPE